ncbi:hypothetical protein [Maribellus maritimus]|uniref:hypothetical protein n=1 Tax=Maribellus maritimus TaxID=2870838 RepID=UPI001EEB317D|nr:hypothetical protein [Maribellus maritimus]MCG6187700.1 hypothetical protein [Maribellus maritimus]
MRLNNAIKILLSFMAIAINDSAWGQQSPINGEFIEYKENDGTITALFHGQVKSKTNINKIVVDCLRKSGEATKNVTLNNLGYADEFFIGPEEGWVWEYEDKIKVTCDDGRSPPVFKSFRHKTIHSKTERVGFLHHICQIQKIQPA